MSWGRSPFEPEPEPGDRWRWAVVYAVMFVVSAALSMRAVRPAVFLAEAAVGLVLLVIVVAGLARLLR
jgi:hypothetical protein